MSSKHLYVCLFGLFLAAQSFAQSAPASAPAKKAVASAATATATAPTKQAAAAVVECDVLAEKQQCCSAASCGGKVLSNRDAHNCKVKSTGKSWHPASDGTNPAACSRM